jgi:hypothetical protein
LTGLINAVQEHWYLKDSSALILSPGNGRGAAVYKKQIAGKTAESFVDMIVNSPTAKILGGFL